MIGYMPFKVFWLTGFIKNPSPPVSINKPKADGRDVKTDVEVPALERPVAGDSKGVNLRGEGTLNPNEIRFSRNSVNGSQEIIEGMAKNGWVGDPIDVVRMSDGGLTTIDNTRVVAARAAGIDV
ncbi:hypothetical protein ACQCVH_06600 [Bacillus infantis]|uniref:hypothetical protein n=1 Tax=Bacillus infantis TaxID=324767 RepID=UPI003CF74DBE